MALFRCFAFARALLSEQSIVGTGDLAVPRIGQRIFQLPVTEMIMLIDHPCALFDIGGVRTGVVLADSLIDGGRTRRR